MNRRVLIPLLLFVLGLPSGAIAQEPDPGATRVVSSPTQAQEQAQGQEPSPGEGDDEFTLETVRIGRDFFDRNGDGQTTAGEIVITIWRYPLYDGGGGQTIRLNQVIIALLILIIGIFISRRVSLIIRKRLSKYRRINPNAAAFFGKLVFYAMVTLIALIALPFAGIPITIFTIIGGALAIGIGFGAQNLINNLISGLILMVDQPIRIGDIVQVGDEEGRIEEIGSRSTRVRRSDGIDVIMPNSMFLENAVVNWTLSDAYVRGKVSVGFAYGSPTGRIRELILQAAEENEMVMKHPRPEVIFEEFGDNALIFEVYFWASISAPMDLRRLKSELRYRIDAHAREAHISIAFPQRDVHLDTLRPLEVRVTREE